MPSRCGISTISSSRPGTALLPSAEPAERP
jgi:hypothetical protein